MPVSACVCSCFFRAVGLDPCEDCVRLAADQCKSAWHQVLIASAAENWWDVHPCINGMAGLSIVEQGPYYGL